MSEESNDVLADALSANKEFQEENKALLARLEKAEAAAETSKAEAKTAKTKATKALNQLTTLNRYNDAENHQIGRSGERKFDEDYSLTTLSNENLDESALMRKADLLAFDSEVVQVHVHDSAELNADNGCIIMVNGKEEGFYRGQTRSVKRMFVAGLCRARKTGYSCRQVIDQNTGDKTYVYPANSGLRFPFSVLEDSQRGKEWLRAELRRP